MLVQSSLAASNAADGGRLVRPHSGYTPYAMSELADRAARVASRIDEMQVHL